MPTFNIKCPPKYIYPDWQANYEGQRLNVIPCAKMATLSTANFMNNYDFFLVFTSKDADKRKIL